MPSLDIFQSWWAMEFRRPDGFEWSTEERFKMIAEVGYRGVGFDAGLAHRPYEGLAEYVKYCEHYDLDVLINAFPRNAADIDAALQQAEAFSGRCRFISVIGRVVPWHVEEVAKVTRGWLQQGEQAGVPIYVEGHRNCMTNDLLFTLQLMDAVPELKMTADLSHFMVNQEWGFLPLEDHEQELISRFLKRCESFQGRIASPEQIQIQPDFPQHKKWVDLFEGWWQEGLKDWKARYADTDERCVFMCELGPPPYAITGSDGYELSSRWDEALRMKTRVENIWAGL
ncbi:MAG: sugar phosphate isomerase/epimerase family protein [Thiolinea sp.]